MSQQKTIIRGETKSNDSTFIFLHGLGDTGMGWSQMLEPFEKMFPKTKFIYPTAKVSPVTLNFGMSMTSWHDIKSLDTLNHADFTGIDDSKQTITDLIDDEVKNGVASDRIILGGFSQGAALSAYTGIQYPKRLGAIVCLSGYTAFDAENAGKIISEANKEVPVLVCHGKMDQVVDFKAGVHLCEKLKINGIPAEGVKAYPNMGHSSCPAEMRDVQAFISKILK